MDPEFSALVLDWFKLHGRKNLPWQKNISPYAVWISEIMLQQTQVNTVIPYFQRFIKKFPHIKKLAAAEIDAILTLWSGLGYYARARNLHKTAQIIAEKYQHKFPADLETLITLPGIGRSTAGAILSLGFNLSATILDGNVKRVLCRYYAIDGWPGKTIVTDKLWQLAEQNTPQKNTASYNQAMMDIGATLCTRSKPKCSICPLQKNCQAYLQGDPQNYPQRKAAKSIPVRTTTMLMLINDENEILLEKRPPVGIWGGLLSFPECDNKNIHDWCKENFSVQIGKLHIWPQVRHAFSHFHLDITPVLAKVEKYHAKIMEPGNTIWYNIEIAKNKELPAAIKKLLEQIVSPPPLAGEG